MISNTSVHPTAMASSIIPPLPPLLPPLLPTPTPLRLNHDCRAEALRTERRALPGAVKSSTSLAAVAGAGVAVAGEGVD